MQDELPAAKPASDPRKLVAKKLEHLAMVGRIVAVPWFEVHAERSFAEHVAKLIDRSPFSNGATPARHSVQEDYIPDGPCVRRLLIAQEGEGRPRYKVPASEARIARNAIVFEGIVVHCDPRDKYRCGTQWSSPSSCSTD